MGQYDNPIPTWFLAPAHQEPNGQIGLRKSCELQKIILYVEKIGLELCKVFLMFPLNMNFKPQSKKPAIAECGPHQLMVNTRRSSQNH